MRKTWFRVRGLLMPALFYLLVVAHPFSGQSNGQGARPRDSRTSEITVANATGAAAEVLALEQKIEAAVVKGVAFADRFCPVTSFRWRWMVRGEKTEGWTTTKPPS
jgi:hypothetical protein